MVKECKAKRIVVVSCSPEIAHPHVRGIDLADPAQVLAHGKTLQEMTGLIQCDALVFQTLEDLKAACIEAAEGNSEIKDFEVGVFCGQYKAPVPADYSERWSRPNGNKKRKSAAITGEEGHTGIVLVASSGPVNVTVPHEALYDDAKGPEYREDVSIYNFASRP
ncbi:hypothetical protein QBC46DRAFT_418544 [Diplogelasinospora grovesii]|uniref:Uncharacterized protein n=1 Tax=Diplogelasinospora grovesii TaxID=303347 RepID=A0AAN6N0Q5_9PEZI|nr:hypothetical protein QBC46DRAFT_418544 [Diplogelasinospora grovesii]